MNGPVDLSDKMAGHRSKALRKRPTDLTAAFRSNDPVSEDFKNGRELTTRQLTYMFDVTGMTILTWRKKRGLPCHQLPGGLKPPVRFDEGLVIEWANRQGIPIVRDDYLEQI